MTARQMEIEDYIVTPDRQDLDADSLFVAIREWKPGIRQLILEDYTGFGDRPGQFYQAVVSRLKGIDYVSGKGLHVYQGPGCVVIERDGLDPKRLLWSKVTADIVRMIRLNRWIGAMEEKTERAAAVKLREEQDRKPWKL